MDSRAKDRSEIIAKRVSADTLAALRTVKKEMANPGVLRGACGARVRLALEAHGWTPGTAPTPPAVPSESP